MSTNIYLYPGETPQQNIRLRDPSQLPPVPFWADLESYQTSRGGSIVRARVASLDSTTGSFFAGLAGPAVAPTQSFLPVDTGACRTWRIVDREENRPVAIAAGEFLQTWQPQWQECDENIRVRQTPKTRAEDDEQRALGPAAGEFLPFLLPQWVGDGEDQNPRLRATPRTRAEDEAQWPVAIAAGEFLANFLSRWDGTDATRKVAWRVRAQDDAAPLTLSAPILFVAFPDDVAAARRRKGAQDDGAAAFAPVAAPTAISADDIFVRPRRRIAQDEVQQPQGIAAGEFLANFWPGYAGDALDLNPRVRPTPRTREQDEERRAIGPAASEFLANFVSQWVGELANAPRRPTPALARFEDEAQAPVTIAAGEFASFLLPQWIGDEEDQNARVRATPRTRWEDEPQAPQGIAFGMFLPNSLPQWEDKDANWRLQAKPRTRSEDEEQRPLPPASGEFLASFLGQWVGDLSNASRRATPRTREEDEERRPLFPPPTTPIITQFWDLTPEANPRVRATPRTRAEDEAQAPQGFPPGMFLPSFVSQWRGQDSDPKRGPFLDKSALTEPAFVYPAPAVAVTITFVADGDLFVPRLRARAIDREDSRALFIARPSAFVAESELFVARSRLRIIDRDDPRSLFVQPAPIPVFDPDAAGPRRRRIVEALATFEAFALAQRPMPLPDADGPAFVRARKGQQSDDPRSFVFLPPTKTPSVLNADVADLPQLTRHWLKPVDPFALIPPSPVPTPTFLEPEGIDPAPTTRRWLKVGDLWMPVPELRMPPVIPVVTLNPIRRYFQTAIAIRSRAIIAIMNRDTPLRSSVRRNYSFVGLLERKRQ